MVGSKLMRLILIWTLVNKVRNNILTKCFCITLTLYRYCKIFKITIPSREQKNRYMEETERKHILALKLTLPTLKIIK